MCFNLHVYSLKFFTLNMTLLNNCWKPVIKHVKSTFTECKSILFIKRTKTFVTFILCTYFPYYIFLFMYKYCQVYNESSTEQKVLENIIACVYYTTLFTTVKYKPKNSKHLFLIGNI